MWQVSQILGLPSKYYVGFLMENRSEVGWKPTGNESSKKHSDEWIRAGVTSGFWLLTNQNEECWLPPASNDTGVFDWLSDW